MKLKSKDNTSDLPLGEPERVLSESVIKERKDWIHKLIEKAGI